MRRILASNGTPIRVFTWQSLGEWESVLVLLELGSVFKPHV